MNRIDWEKRTVRHMIELRCSRLHKGASDAGGAGERLCTVGLCPECHELLEYAMARLDHCKFGNNKIKCHKCSVHCYRPDMRERIRSVMRFSGPRMILHHPLEAIRYIVSK